MIAPLVFAAPSKGRLKEQVEAWLADCGLGLETAGPARAYVAALAGFEDVQVRLVSAADIAVMLGAGEAHLGITGEDLLAETGESAAARTLALLPLGFGRADLVVAAPKSWIDVAVMADLAEVARHFLARTGRRLRVATKYPNQTRSFFAARGIADYRLVDSAGATEGAPAAGAAELIVDITSSGATLSANGLKPLRDGLILSSQAQLAAGLNAPWTAAQRKTAARLLRIVEARARGKASAVIGWPTAMEAAARGAIAGKAAAGEGEPGRALVPAATLLSCCEALASAGVGPVIASRPSYVFEADSPAAARLEAGLGQKPR